MSFYQTLPHQHQLKKWTCPNCDLVNDANAIKCAECFFEREDVVEVAADTDARCTCLQYEGDDLRCPVHGVTK